MDELTALFANKPTSYLGAGLIFNGDASGNGVSSTEQDVVVVKRFNPNDAAGEFKGLWYPKRGSSDTQVIITGGSIFDGTTLHTVAGATLSEPELHLPRLRADGDHGGQLCFRRHGECYAHDCDLDFRRQLNQLQHCRAHPALHLAGRCAGGSLCVFHPGL
jgi:hypothetical protein